MKRSFLLTMSAIIIAGLVGCSAQKTKETAFYVSLAGNDSWSGKLAEPNKKGSDGPFATLEKAREAVRAFKKQGALPAGGVTVYLRGGVYPVTATFTLIEEDSGTETAPIVWRSSPGESVKLFGGKTVTGFGPVSDPSVANRISASYRDSILVADLKAQEITDFGKIDPASGKRIELYFKGKFMSLARYPNEGWLTIADVPQSGTLVNPGAVPPHTRHGIPTGRHYGRFTYDGDRPNLWARKDDVWVHGYWVWDWSDQYLPVKSIDTKTRTVYPMEPHHGYGYCKGQRFCFLNILEELDVPGEWYLDSANGLLYFWPPSTMSEGDAFVSLLEPVMLSIENASFITVRDIVFEGGRGNAVKIQGGKKNLIAGCTFRNFGLTVASVDGGAENGISSCDIYDVAAGGIDLGGGDRKTLTPAGNFADNNHIHDYGKILKTYQPAVQIVSGVGNRITHNLIHDAPHSGLFLVTQQAGNDHLVEYNELHSLAKETGDVGAIHVCARDYTQRGVIIRYNYFHNIHGPGDSGATGIYLDDFTSGTTVYGNIVYDADRGCILGGGRNNTYENNYFIDCTPSVHIDGRGLGWAKGFFEGPMGVKEHLEAMNYKEPPYSKRYPELLTLLEDEPAVPKYNTIRHNVSLGGKWMDFCDGLDFKVIAVKENVIADSVLCNWQKKLGGKFTTYLSGDKEMVDILEADGNILTSSDQIFVNTAQADFHLKENSPALKLGIEQIPVEKIGLYINEYRTSLPSSK